jgi:periplasmic mercuric ion binding protein
MKTLKIKHLFFLTFLLTGIVACAQKKDEQKVTFSVNITCEHCKMSIMKNIPYEKGVTDVSVDLDKKEVTVTFKKDKITKEQLIKAFEKIGYTAVEKEEEPTKK